MKVKSGAPSIDGEWLSTRETTSDIGTGQEAARGRKVGADSVQLTRLGVWLARSGP
jgi:hypothetical protein